MPILSSALIPYAMPVLFWTLRGKVVVDSVSLLKKSAAGIVKLLTINPSAFSAVP